MTTTPHQLRQHLPAPPAPAHDPRRAGSLCAVLVAGAAVLVGCTNAADAGTPSAGGESSPPPAATTQQATGYPVTITDCGEEVTFEEAPETVLTIGCDAIALIDAAGAADRIVARSGEFDAELPQGLTQPPTDAVIIDPSDPTTEQIVGSGVDVVIGYGFFNADPVSLTDSGIPTLTVSGECGHDVGTAIEPVTFDVVLSDIDRFGRLFDTSATASSSIADLRERLDAVVAQHPDALRTAATVYYFSTSSPLSAYGGTGIIQSIMEGAGLENVYGAEPQTYLEISLESLLDADPEVIVLAYGLHGDTVEEAKARLLAEPGMSDLQAVRADRIIGIPANETAASPASVAGLERLQRAVAELG